MFHDNSNPDLFEPRDKFIEDSFIHSPRPTKKPEYHQKPKPKDPKSD